MDPHPHRHPPPPSASSRKKYDVFISFRGEDTRYNFTSHLHRALLQKNVETFVDDRLERGDKIEHALLNAIEDSKLSLIIFSENYASSRWCLDELVHILMCKEKNKQIVIPVFYHVTPSDVRKQAGSYGVAFAKLEERFKDRTGKLEQWREALTTAANLSGWDAPIDRYESELVESILKDIMEKLNYTLQRGDGFHALVGIDRHIEHIESLLLSSNVHIVGIWGIGGMGKTTLAHAVFNRLRYQFEGHCFLENVREEWKKQGIIQLRNRLLAQLLKDQNPYMVDVQFVKNRLCRRKVLIVFDDIDDLEKFQHLVGDHDWFNPESKIIITTRNKQVLKSIEVDKIYKAEQLDENDALQLFCLNAFKSNSPTGSYLELSKKVVRYAAGLPLALKVLGSHLYSKCKDEWESALNRLKKVPNKEIHNKLRISYDDGLDYQEQEIFLDIACFFKGQRRDFVGKILDDCGAFADVLRNLIDKSFITVTHDNKLWMHDLVQEMGWAIVRQQCIAEPGKRSRLWSTRDICHVLKNNSGTSTIEGMFLNAFEVDKDIDMKPIVFREMYNLRLLQIVVRVGTCKLHLSQGLEFLPDALRYLNWIQYPSKSLPSSFTPNSLVKLDMPLSQLEQLWSGFQHLESLRFLGLCFSKKLTHIPNLSRANLKIVDFEGCTSLVEVPSLRFQKGFEKPELERNEKSFLNQITSNIWSKREDLIRYGSSLLNVLDYSLNLSRCSNLKTLSEISGAIENIYLRSTAIEELHSSIWSLEHLILLDLNNCRCLKNLPSNICKLESLKEINLGGCVSIDKFPELPKNIVEVDLSQTAIQEVPSSSFECLPSLEVLNLKNCTRLKFLPTSICKLKSLKYLDLSETLELKSFPEILEPMECLIDLRIDGSRIEEIPWSIENLIRLRKLFLRRCQNLKFLPRSIYNISCLVDIRLPDILEWDSDTEDCYQDCFQDCYPGSSPRSISHISVLEFLGRESKENDPLFCEASSSPRSISQSPRETDESKIIYWFEGNRIPRFCTYQSEGSSVNFKFSSPSLDSDAIVTLRLCIVVEFSHFFVNLDGLKFLCECHFKCPKNIGRRATDYRCSFSRDQKGRYIGESNYLFWWDVQEKFNNVHDIAEVSFDFYVEQADGKARVKVCQVIKCGIHVPYYEKISHELAMGPREEMDWMLDLTPKLDWRPMFQHRNIGRCWI